MIELAQRAAALIELLTAASASAESTQSAERATSLIRSLVDSGQWKLAIELSNVCRRRAASAQVLAECLSLEIECYLGMAQYGNALDLACNSASEIARTEGAEVSSVLALIEVLKGRALWGMNRLNEAEEILNRTYSYLLNRPDSSVLGWCACNLGAISWARGDLTVAKQRFHEAVVSAVRARNFRLEAMAYRNLGLIQKQSCRWHEAREHLEHSLELWKALANRAEAVHVQRTLAIVCWKLGNLGDATRLAEASRSGAAESSAVEAEVHALQLMALAALHRGSYDVAKALLAEASRSWPGSDTSRPFLLNIEFLGDVHLEQNQSELAIERYDSLWPKVLALTPKGDIVAELRRRRAECYFNLGRQQEAFAEAMAGILHCRELGDRYEEAATYRVVALSAAALGRASEARQWFHQGFAFYEDIETPYEWAKLWMAYGDWLSGSDAGEYRDMTGALDAYRVASEHFENIGADARLAEARTKLESLKASLTATEAAKSATSGVVSPQVRDLIRPSRRPRGSGELERRAAWAVETFGFVTRNKIALDLLEEVAKLADSGTHVLILGESGTGKELVAEGLHKLGKRSGRFMAINCGALPRDVIESELFGHVAGAFTGATRDKAGLLEACAGGTAFLDEIGEMSVDLQTRLLRFLESGEVRRVGSNKTTIVDTQIVAATNRERGALERREGFRTDLYYRLAHAVIELPPLRRRGDDVDVLVGHFLAESCKEFGKNIQLSDAARNRLVAYPWPGNVRQLRSAMRRLVILTNSGETVGPEAVALDHSDVPSSLTEELEQAERRRIVEALSQSRGVRTEAARLLGMSRTTLLGKMKRYGIH
ncbi:MAG TPA: sigma 54-interacting transcriptional regulator [Candidatus Limnocylindria bacterium]|nr:sigma 54-interacting transcriptional regulator [Candidatus Limnocylindria bacterium]